DQRESRSSGRKPILVQPKQLQLSPKSWLQNLQARRRTPMKPIGKIVLLLLAFTTLRTPQTVQAQVEIAPGSFLSIDFPGAAGTTPVAINARNEIVGLYSDGTTNHAFLLKGGK